MKKQLYDVFTEVVKSLNLRFETKEIAEKTGQDKGNVSKYLNNKKQLSKSFLIDFTKAFNLDFDKYFSDFFVSANAELIDSNGLLGGVSSFGTSDGDVRFIDLENGEIVMFVPLVEPYAQAGYLTGYGDKQFMEELPTYPITVSRQHRGSYLACRVTGESMYDGTANSIPDKSVAVGRIIKKELWRSKFHLHKWEDYIIVHREGILIKRITEHDIENGTIKIHSLNPDKEKYPDEILNLDDCLQICNVIHVGVSRSTF